MDASGSALSGNLNRQRNERVAAATKKTKYTAKEKWVNQAKKKEEKVAKKPVVPWQKVMHRV